MSPFCLFVSEELELPYAASPVLAAFFWLLNWLSLTPYLGDQPRKWDMATATKKKPANTTGESGKPQAFQAEVAKLLHLMVHSVYSDRDVFLRELLSNASDALDKLRYAAIATPALLEQEADLKISITTDKTAGTLTITDTGIGMTAEELAENLGTIARSGTQSFMKDTKYAPDLIGQFGVGFYAAFMVAEKVEVFSRKAGAKTSNVWTSDGLGTFTVEASQAKQRGTSVVLHLKSDAKDFIEAQMIERVVKSYSDHIAHPILLVSDGEEQRQINSASAIWSRAKSEVNEEQHREFYQSLFFGNGDPALTIHYRAEGKQEYSVLLYVPKERPFDLYDPERKGKQKLYVRRVFIADDAHLLPSYLRFTRGVIDSSDMPLNLSREMLQNNPDVAAIRKAVTNRVLSELKKFADKDGQEYSKFWDVFGNVVKEGLYEDFERREQLFELCRFASTTGPSRTLKDYVSSLKENQTAIYYLTAEDAKKAAGSPQLEGYKARGIEVLLFTDPIDAFWVRTAAGFDGKPFVSVAQGAGDLDRIKPAEAKDEEPVVDDATLALINAMKSALGDRVSDVRVSKRLTESAACLVNDGHMDRTLERLLSRQKDSGVEISAPALEINAGHALVKALAAATISKGDTAVTDAAHLLLDQAYVLEGENIADPAAFAKRLGDVITKAFA
jgi:molecular chaperone HtpG